MEQITSLKIVGITLENFRRFTEPVHFDMGDISLIFGHNGSGKTTLAHAVCYALYGVSYYGEQKIERLMNEKSDSTKVELQFADQNGELHTLIRSRHGDKTSVYYDGFSVNQALIDGKFCDKHAFLSMFNPLYLTEQLSEAQGRELVLKLLKPIPAKEVLAQMGESARYLEGIELSTTPIEDLLKAYRSEKSRCEDQILRLDGHIAGITENVAANTNRLASLKKQLAELTDEYKLLSEKQFDGIELDEIAIQRDVLTSKLAENSRTENPAITELQEKLAEAKQRVYVSKFSDVIAEARTAATACNEKFDKITARLDKLKLGVKCPVCYTAITEENLEVIRNNMVAERQRIMENGKGIVDRGKDAREADEKAKKTFEQFRQDDIRKYESEIAALKAETVAVQDTAEIKSALEKLDIQGKYGNLTKEEYDRLCGLKESITECKAQIKATGENADSARITELQNERLAFEKQRGNLKDIISALLDFVSKRTELATKSIEMPKVSLRLFEVTRTTGEIKSTFKFNYGGREYSTLSLSEKTLAGTEIAAMMRKLSGIDCPVCIDNTESVASFNGVPMPTQSLLIRFVKGEALQIKTQSRPGTASAGTGLKKAS